jgi:hypothetical protein
MYTHIKLKNIIKNNELISSMDHLIACDNHGWTDLRFTQLDNRLTPESKYFLAININQEPHILYYDNLLNLRNEINEKMIKSSYFEGYDKINNRVHLHYERDGIFRIGNKKGLNIFRVQFEECSLKELAKRHDYSQYLSFLDSKEIHRGVQTLLCELGISLGFNVKLAINDQSKILKQNPSLELSQKVLNFYDLNLGNIEEKKVKNDIDRIDALWLDNINNKIIMAFEVEFSNNYSNAFERFSSLCEAVHYQVYLIGVGNDYINFRSNLNRPIWRAAFSSSQIECLSLNELCNILNLNKEIGSSLVSFALYKKLIERLLPVTLSM